MDDLDDLLGYAPDAGKNNLRIALKLAAQGIPVFPCREKSGTVNGKLRKEKSPATKNGFKDATTDEGQIRTWWRHRPYALVGMPTGQASGYAVVDLDRHKADADGIAALAGMGLKPSELTPLRVRTAGNGIHLFFKHQHGITNADKHLPKGIDVRAEGGFVIAPGSRFDDGRVYTEIDLKKNDARAPSFPAALLPPTETQHSDGGEKKPRLGLSVEQIADYLKDLPNDASVERHEWIAIMASLHHEATAPDEDGEVRSKAEQRAICRLAVKWTAKNEAYNTKEHLKQAEQDFWSFRTKPQKNLATFRSIVAEVNDIRRDRGIENDFDTVDDLGDDDPDGFEDQPEEDDEIDDLLGTSAPKPAPKKKSPSQQRLAREQVEDALGKAMPKWVRRLNTKFAVALVSGKTVILHLKKDGGVHYGSVNDLHNFHENDRVEKDDTTVPITKVWMQSKHRRTYPDGIIFAPNREVEGAYNHWQGFSVEPSTAKDPSKGCKLFLKHLKEVICDGNEEYYRYHLGWLAHMIQRPEDKPGVAVVYKGRKRIGKDTPFEYLGELFKPHYVTVGHQDQMVGKFNAHQEKCLLLHVQEGFWAGNKQAEGALKYLITSRQVTIEPKGVNSFQVPSVLRLFISSNERWVIPATEDEGRFFVLNVSEMRRNDHAYFAALREEMEGDGPASLLAYLQQYDISDFEVRKVPDTDALGEQKIQGLKNIEAWWLNTLQVGEIEGIQNHGAGGVDASEWEIGSVRIDKNDFRDGYSRWMRTRRFDGEEVTEIEFGIRMKRLCPSADTKQFRASGRRGRVYVLPPLDQCREDFEVFLGNKIAWPSHGPGEIVGEDDLG